MYLQSQVTPTQMMTTQTTDDTPIIATRIITTHHKNIEILLKLTCDSHNSLERNAG